MEKGLKILILEDNASDAAILQRFLLREMPAVEFKWVMTEADYLDALEHYKPDLILSDNTLPQFNATEALKLFKQRNLTIPFILVTGTVSEDFAVGIIKAGADDYILKGSLIRLPAAIAAAMQKKKAEAAIRHSEEVRKLIMNAALDAIVCIDTDGTITVWNPQAEKLFGWIEEEVKGKLLSELIIPEQFREAVEAGFKHYLITGEAPILNKAIEMPALNRQGNEFAVEIAIVHIQQNAADFFCAYIRDITERKKAEEKISFNANLLNTVGQAVIAIDMKGEVNYWNNAAEKIYGWTAEEAIGKNIVDLVPAQQSKEQAKEIMKELNAGNMWSGEFLVQRKDGTLFPAYVTDSPVHDKQGALTGIIGVSFDITERKKAEETLKLMEKKILDQKIEEQRKISRAIIKAQEEEKNYIGKELHDNISQILASSKMYLSSAAKKNEAIKDLISFPIELINNSIEEIRTLSHRQVTPVKNINLKDLVNKLLTNNNGEVILNTDFAYEVDEQILSDDLKLNIYRILQEQMNNIIKHAHAENIKVFIKTIDTNITISVADDGKGFNLSEKRNGIGISNMMNRVESYNGKLSIKSSPGKGCKINVTIPC